MVGTCWTSWFDSLVLLRLPLIASNIKTFRRCFRLCMSVLGVLSLRLVHSSLLRNGRGAERKGNHLCIYIIHYDFWMFFFFYKNCGKYGRENEWEVFKEFQRNMGNFVANMRRNILGNSGGKIDVHKGAKQYFVIFASILYWGGQSCLQLNRVVIYSRYTPLDRGGSEAVGVSEQQTTENSGAAGRKARRRSAHPPVDAPTILLTFSFFERQFVCLEYASAFGCCGFQQRRVYTRTRRPRVLCRLKVQSGQCCYLDRLYVD